jgi:hypothetical protein
VLLPTLVLGQGSVLLRSSVKGSTPSGPVTSTAIDADRQGLDVYIRGGGAGDGKILDGAGAGEADVMGSAPSGTEQGLVVRPIPSGTQTVSGTVTVTQGTGTNLHMVCDSGCGGGTQYTEDTASAAGDALTMAGVVRKDTAATLVDTDGDRTQLQVDATGRLWVNGSGVTQPVSGTVTANQGGAPWAIRLQDGAASALATVTGANALKVDGSAVTQPVSGTVSVSNYDGIVRDGTGDTTQANVSSGRLHVDGSGVTQPVSGTVSAAQSGTWTVGLTTFTSLVTFQQSVTASAVALSSNTAKRVCLKVKDGGTQTVYFGPSGVTTATGQELLPGESYCTTLDNANRIYVIAAGTGSTVAVNVEQ